MDKLDKIPESQSLPMDYKLGQIVQTVAKLAQSNTDVGQDAVMILGTATICTALSQEDANMNYGRDNGRERQEGRQDDKCYDRNRARRGKQQRKPCRPKVEIKCNCCKLWGHEETHCNHLAKTIFIIKYTKKNGEKSKKVYDTFCKRNSREIQALIKTLKALPHRQALTLPPVQAMMKRRTITLRTCWEPCSAAMSAPLKPKSQNTTKNFSAM
jgi:hypothetical protein